MTPKVLQLYQDHVIKRKKLGIPPLPLNARQVKELAPYVFDPPEGCNDYILDILKNNIPSGVDPAALEKSKILRQIALSQKRSSLLSSHQAVTILGMMKGGYNIQTLIELLGDEELSAEAVDALSGTILIFGFFDRIKELSFSNEAAKRVLESWARAEWFEGKAEIPDTQKMIIFKVPGEVNTDDLSPASHAGTRADIPLHALSMLEIRYPGALDEISELRKKQLPIAFAADVAGTGSSRKSAVNSLIWWIGSDIPGIPNKRRGGVILGSQIAPIFFNTLRDSGAIPIRCDVSLLKSGDIVILDFKRGKLLGEKGKEVVFNLEPETIYDEYRAGGRLQLIIGKELTRKAQEALGINSDIFIKSKEPKLSVHGYTLAQKIVGKACGLRGVRPGQSCLPRITTVGSQDTTGPMTADEIRELVCLEFQAPLVMQSFCHTAAYPTIADKEMHRELSEFFKGLGGVALKPGDGIIHSWLNRMILPDTVGTGGDSHTRFPIGISFPAGSGLVAFAAALGVMPLDMPESVLVRFKGTLKKGIFLRDAVNAIPYYAKEQGKLTLDKKNKKNIFNGRILEIEGLNDLSVEHAFELTDASAERSAEASAIALSENSVAEFLENSILILKSLVNEGYPSEPLKRRIKAMQEWLSEPSLLKADPDAEYADKLDIDLSDINEPLLACPNDPDFIQPLSAVAGTRIDEVFIGSCMIGLAHLESALCILEEAGSIETKLWISPPTRLIEKSLEVRGKYTMLRKIGARIEIPGCSLCMGNQARVADNAVVLSTSTRNFDNRMGKNAKVFLVSAAIAAVTALLGRIPTLSEYYEHLNKNP